MNPLVVVADDRTGAMETAGMCADRGHSAVVVPFGMEVPEGSECTVIDLASRHLSADDAAARAMTVPLTALHKIDSTLRGAWAYELVARARVSAQRVLVVPAFPAAGRTCIGGLVMVDGVPVAEGSAGGDVRAPIASSRPAEHLRAAGAGELGEIDLSTLDRWLESPSPSIAVCDAVTDDDLASIAMAWVGARGVVLAGSAATVAATIPRRDPPSWPEIEPPMLVVCGSLHPMAIAQADAAAAAGARVLRSPETSGDPGLVAASLARAARDAIAAHRPRTVFVIGGDTSEALLEDRVVQVGGTVAPGVAWSRAWGDDGPLLLTKPGGFGTASTIVDLFAGTLQ